MKNSTWLLLAACWLAISPMASASPILYSVRSNADDHLYSIDAATGVATDLGGLNFADAEGLSFVGNTLYAIGGSEHEFWNITTPPGTLVGNTGSRAYVDAGLDYNPATGVMYNINSGSIGSVLYTIDLSTGAATSVADNRIFLGNLAIDAAGNAYAIDGWRTDALYSINLISGAATLIGNLGIDFNHQFGLTFAGGQLYALNASGNLYTIDISTGAATYAVTTTCGGGICNGWEGLAAPNAAVPEPQSVALLGLGLVGLGWARTRRCR